MADTLGHLEKRRRWLFQELADLGDFRPGMISVNYRKCGKTNCVCAQTGHAGHGPQYLWNTTQGNRSRSQVIRLGPHLQRVEAELANYRRFGELCKELIRVNEQICRLRPRPEAVTKRSWQRDEASDQLRVQARPHIALTNN
jgi:hypothetical protein